MTDPIADMLARIRNAIVARKAKVLVPRSRLKLELANVLKDEGFVNAVSQDDEGPQGTILIELRYDQNNQNPIQAIRRVSRPGQRTYVRHNKMHPVRQGLGTAILSTSKGVMTDRAARKQGLGGEILCEVW